MKRKSKQSKPAEPVPRIDRPMNLVTQVERILREAIAEGRFRGNRLPTDAELAEQIGVSRETVRRATTALAKEGLLVKFRRKGTFLKAPEIRLPTRVAESRLIGYVQADYRLAGGGYDPTTRHIGGLMIQGAIEAANEAGYALLVARARPAELSKAFDLLIRSARLRGIIFASVAEEKMLRRVIGLGLPTVLIDHDLHLPRISIVRDDSAGGSQLAVEQLAALGHRRIGFANWFQTDLNPWRLEGYRQALRKLNLPRRRNWEFNTDLSAEGARGVVDALLDLSPQPTALYCFNNSLAQLVIDELQARGVRVPEEISVVGGGGESIPGIACNQADWPELGRQGVEIALRGAEAEDEPEPLHRVTGHTWCPGSSCGKAPEPA